MGDPHHRGRRGGRPRGRRGNRDGGLRRDSVGSIDYDAVTAERYGWVTRTIADAELDGFVDGVATRLASFDRTALAAAKAQVNRATLPPDADLRAAYTEFLSSLAWPGVQAFLPRFEKLLAEKGPEEVELR